MKVSTMKRPLVSVCIPTYNRAHMLPGCIDGILRQTMTDFEIVVSDNASEDQTETVVRSFDDKRIRYIKNGRNIGVRNNWEQSLALGRGHYVTIFPDDDLMMPENLEKKSQVLANDSKIGLVHSKYHVIDGDGKLLRHNTNWGHGPERTADGMEILEAFLAARWNTINAPTVMFKRECYDRLGGFTEKLNFSLDWEYWMRIAVYYRVYFLAEPLVKWRVHAGSCTSQSIGVDQLLKLKEDLLAKKLITDGHVRTLTGGGAIKKLIWRNMAERFADVMVDVYDQDKKKSGAIVFGLGAFYHYPELLHSKPALKAFAKSLLP